MTTEALNHRQYCDGRTGVYEVWYLTWNHPATGQGFWLRYVIEAPTRGAAHAELWFARFDPKDPARTFGFHRRFPITTVADTTDPFTVTIADARLAHDHAFGATTGDGHTVEWDLHWAPADRPLLMYPELAYRAHIGDTTAKMPNPRVLVSGKIVVDGEHLDLDRVTAGQNHLWGTRHAYAWTWAHCTELAGAPGVDTTLFELIAARLHRGRITTPPLVMAVLDLDGERLAFNQFRHVARNRARWSSGRVAFTARSATHKLEGELVATPERMINAPYLDPDGRPIWCANTEIGDARLIVYERAGLTWRERCRLACAGRAHFEVGGRTRDPAVTREHVTVE
jgi:hypothetical protein